MSVVANLPSRATWLPKGDVAERQLYGLYGSHLKEREAYALIQRPIK